MIRQSLKKLDQTLGFDTFFEGSLNFLCTQTNFMVFSIVKVGVFEHLPDIVYKLLSRVIYIVVKLLLYCPQIYGLCYDIEVIENSEFCWIHRLMEPISWFHFPTQVEHFGSNFFPTFLKGFF